MHNGCFYDLLTAVLVVGNPKGSIGRSSMIYMMVKKIKQMLLQYKITLLLALYIFCLFFRLIPFVGLCYFYKLNN